MQIKIQKKNLSASFLALCFILSSCSYIGTPLFLQDSKSRVDNPIPEKFNHGNHIRSHIEETFQPQDVINSSNNSIELFSTIAQENLTKQTKIHSAEKSQPIIKEKVTEYTYTIQPNDTLYSIAVLSKTSVANLKYINGITNPTQIAVGSVINVTYPISKKALLDRKIKIANRKKLKKPSWVWPTKGKLTQKYNPNRIGGKGIRISAPKNTSVRASNNGVIAYSGNNIKGYGSVVIIEHDNNIISIYGFLNQSLVKKGQKIAKSQKIGTVGTAPNKKSLLHFEIHKNGKHTNPFKYIKKKVHL